MVLEPLDSSVTRSGRIVRVRRTTDVVLDSDNGVFHLVSIYEGHSLPHIIFYLNCVDGDSIDNSTKIRTELSARLQLHHDY